jgi:DNA primase catalytic core
VIPAAVVDQILSAAVIEEVIGEYVDLKKSGSTYRGLSPFTSEKTPSFYVVPAKGIFKCFSSGKAGSLVTFLMEKEKISYPEALRLLARRYNIEVPEEAPSAEFQAERSERESLAAVLAWAATWFADRRRPQRRPELLPRPRIPRRHRGLLRHRVVSGTLGRDDDRGARGRLLPRPPRECGAVKAA